jgi:MoaA/NifB/PqqE/SkfB family radical SAM enzyme
MIFSGPYKEINMITWVINNKCNFACCYCPQYKYPPDSAIEIRDLSSGLSHLEKEWLFLITGGEPFLEANFIQICQEITKKNAVALNTNLSTANNFEFADTIDPQKCLFVNTAVHIAEREKRDPDLKLYINKIHYYQKKGFYVIASYLAHPSLLNRMKADIRFLKSNGINKVIIKVFRGTYDGKEYPCAFNEHERNLFLDFDTEYPELEILNGSHNYFNNLCRAGQRFFVMDRLGNMKRCSSLLKDYGNFFNHSFTTDQAAKSCPVKDCVCPYEGIRNAVYSKGNILYTLKESIIEKYLKLENRMHDPYLMKKIKIKTRSYIEAHHL